MKKLLLLSLTLLANLNLFAGTADLPSEDQVIQTLRSQFAISVEPDSKDIKKTVYSCYIRTSIKGSNYNVPLKISIKDYDYFYTLSSKNLFFTDSLTLTATGTELYGELNDKYCNSVFRKNSKCAVSLRYDLKGNLIGEVLQREGTREIEGLILDPITNVEDKNLKVSHYFICK